MHFYKQWVWLYIQAHREVNVLEGGGGGGENTINNFFDQVFNFFIQAHCELNFGGGGGVVMMLWPIFLTKFLNVLAFQT